MTIIRGALGDNSGSQHTPVELPDSLRSDAYAQLLDLISEGEIGGLVNGAASIYLNDTPLENDDGTRNFTGVTFEQRTGTQGQSSIDGFPSVENSISVGTEITNGTPVTRTVTDANVSKAVVVVGFPYLSQQLDNGDLIGASVQLKIELQSNGGGFQPVPVTTTLTTISTVNESVTVTSPAASTRYFLRVNWHGVVGKGRDGPTTTDLQWIKYKIEYKLHSGSTWTTLRTGDFSGKPYEKWSGGSRGSSSLVQPSDSNSFDIDLPSGVYDFRVTRTDAVAGTLGAGQQLSLLASYAKDTGGIDTINGKTTTRYQRAYEVQLTGSAPWDIRVTRITPDSTSSKLNNKTYWDSYTEVIDAKLRYPNSALVALSCDASQFQSIPSRAYDVKLLKVQIPDNYDPVARTYTGAWSGNLVTAWTDNPAWCFYDLLTNARYGLGEFIDATQVDKWSLYAIAQYCDEIVPDGLGNAEPRFTCNIYLQTRAEAYKVMQDMAAIFRGMAYWSSGAITAVQDAPGDASYLYTPANVIDGVFTYQGASAKARHTVALVTWNDPQDLCRQKVEYVEDAAGISRFGVVQTEVVAVGCTSRGQAHRVGKWLLYSERLESETVTFRTGVEGMVARPGQVIKIADPARAGARLGGRVVTGSTSSSIILDSAVTLSAGQTYTLAVINTSGAVEERTVTTGAGTVATLTVSPAFTGAPQAQAIWILSSNAVSAQTFRVVSVVEAEKNEFEITALAHDPSKYDAIENDLTLQDRVISYYDQQPAAPAGILVTEFMYLASGQIKTRMNVACDAVYGATAYEFWYSKDSSNPTPRVRSNTPNVEYPDVTPGNYTVFVVAINPTGRRSVVSSATQYIAGKTAPPSDVAGFVVARSKSTLFFSWAHIADIDRASYEIRRGLLWDSAIVVGTTAGNTFSVDAPYGGDFMIKAIDTSGNYSTSPAYVNVPDLSGINVIVYRSEGDAGFPGTHSNTEYFYYDTDGTWDEIGSWDRSGSWDFSHRIDGVTLDAGTTWASITGTWDSYTKPWLFINPASSGVYTCGVIDLSYIATSRLSITPTLGLLSWNGAPWSSYTQPWTSYAGPTWTWQGPIGLISAKYEMRISDDAVTWSAWNTFTPGVFKFRYLQFRVTMATKDTNYLPMLLDLTASIDVPDRVLHFEDVAVSTSGATISFSPAFVDVSTVQCTLQSATSGDRYTVTGKSANSVTINVFDSAGVAKAGIVDVDVFGYGEKY